MTDKIKKFLDSQKFGMYSVVLLDENRKALNKKVFELLTGEEFYRFIKSEEFYRFIKSKEEEAQTIKISYYGELSWNFLIEFDYKN